MKFESQGLIADENNLFIEVNWDSITKEKRYSAKINVKNLHGYFKFIPEDFQFLHR